MELQYYNPGGSTIGAFYPDPRSFDREVFAAIRTHAFRFIIPPKKSV